MVGVSLNRSSEKVQLCPRPREFAHLPNIVNSPEIFRILARGLLVSAPHPPDALYIFSASGSPSYGGLAGPVCPDSRDQREGAPGFPDVD